jgi:hypothetical protein
MVRPRSGEGGLCHISSVRTFPLFLRPSHPCISASPCKSDKFSPAAPDTLSALVSFTSSSNRTRCPTFSAHTSSAWRAMHPSLTSICLLCGLRRITATAVGTAQAYWRSDRAEGCTLMCLTLPLRMRGMDQVSRPRRTRVGRYVFGLLRTGQMCDFPFFLSYPSIFCRSSCSYCYHSRRSLAPDPLYSLHVMTTIASSLLLGWAMTSCRRQVPTFLSIFPGVPR